MLHRFISEISAATIETNRTYFKCARRSTTKREVVDQWSRRSRIWPRPASPVRSKRGERYYVVCLRHIHDLPTARRYCIFGDKLAAPKALESRTWCRFPWHADPTPITACRTIVPTVHKFRPILQHGVQKEAGLGTGDDWVSHRQAITHEMKNVQGCTGPALYVSVAISRKPNVCRTYCITAETVSKTSHPNEHK